MISLRIKDTKVFMSQLLIKDTFDRMLLSEATIKTACSYTINGQINKEYYSDEEWDNLNNNEKSYSEWSNIKPFCFSLINPEKIPNFGIDYREEYFFWVAAIAMFLI